jgi:hypothetical protein
MLRLTKSLLKVVVAFFLRQESYVQFIRALLSMRVVSTHESLKIPGAMIVLQLSRHQGCVSLSHC